MKVVIERCAGLDVHKKTAVACVRTPRSGRAKERLRETQTFATTMKELEARRGWLERPTSAMAGQPPCRPCGLWFSTR